MTARYITVGGMLPENAPREVVSAADYDKLVLERNNLRAALRLIGRPQRNWYGLWSEWQPALKAYDKLMEDK